MIGVGNYGTSSKILIVVCVCAFLDRPVQRQKRPGLFQRLCGQPAEGCRRRGERGRSERGTKRKWDPHRRASQRGGQGGCDQQMFRMRWEAFLWIFRVLQCSAGVKTYLKNYRNITTPTFGLLLLGICFAWAAVKVGGDDHFMAPYDHRCFIGVDRTYGSHVYLHLSKDVCAQHPLNYASLN